MITISELFVYPIKSCCGTSVTAIEVTPKGLANDRNWMVVDQNGVSVTQREQPRLALVKPDLGEHGLAVNAPGMPELTIGFEPSREALEVELFGERLPARATSTEADAWFSRYLGAPHRLVVPDPGHVRKGGVQYPARDHAPTSFTDNYGLLVLSQASLDDLNGRMPSALPVNRFRPNIVVKGIDAYHEDYFATARAGGIELRFIDVCYRCNLTTIDQEKAEFGEEPLITLGGYRNIGAGVRFGNYAAVAAGFGKSLSVGQPLDVSMTF